MILALIWWQVENTCNPLHCLPISPCWWCYKRRSYSQISSSLRLFILDANKCADFAASRKLKFSFFLSQENSSCKTHCNLQSNVDIGQLNMGSVKHQLLTWWYPVLQCHDLPSRIVWRRTSLTAVPCVLLGSCLLTVIIPPELKLEEISGQKAVGAPEVCTRKISRI